MGDDHRLSALKIDPESRGALIAFVGIHIACLGALWTGVKASDLLLCLALYLIRLFGITAGYHRYFAHRAYKTSRIMQFILGFIAQTSMQSGLIWWASKHRDHHKYVETPKDVHSPRQYGFWFAHLGWIFNDEAQRADYSNVPDLTRYPELRWLDRNRFGPGILMGLVVWALFGWSGLVVGFLWSTVLVWHATFAINSLAHVFGRQRYLTGDDSRNNWLLAILSLGEGWHNNHHYYMSSVRQGFFWWEIDLTFYGLKAMSWLGLVWDLKQAPERVRAGQRGTSQEIYERVAQLLAASFPTERIAARVRARWTEAGRTMDELRQRAEDALSAGRENLAELHWPELPTMDDLHARARRKFARSDKMDEIVARARELLARGVARCLLDDTALPHPA